MAKVVVDRSLEPIIRIRAPKIKDKPSLCKTLKKILEFDLKDEDRVWWDLGKRPSYKI